MGILGLVIGTLAAQVCGTVIYNRLGGPSDPEHSAQLRFVAGITSTACASVIFVFTGVHEWLLPGSHWGLSVFMAGCLAFVQGILSPTRPVAPPDKP